MSQYGFGALCHSHATCIGDGLIVSCSLLSILSLLIVVARLAVYRKGDRWAREAPISRVIRTAVVFLLLTDIAYHSVDIPFTLDWGTVPIYFVIDKPGYERARDRTITYLMIREGLSMMVGWSHCHLAWVTFNWVAKDRLMYLPPHLHLFAIFAVLAVTTLRISLVHTAGRSGLFASLMLYVGLVGPLCVALTSRWYFLALRRLNELAQLPVEDPPPTPAAPTRSDSSCSSELDVYSEGTPEGVGSLPPMRVTYGWLSGKSHATRHQRLGRQLLALCAAWPVLWSLTCATGVAIWTMWFSLGRTPPLPLVVVRILSNRLVGFADALLLGGLALRDRFKAPSTAREGAAIVLAQISKRKNADVGEKFDPPPPLSFFAMDLPSMCSSSDQAYQEHVSIQMIPPL